MIFAKPSIVLGLMFASVLLTSDRPTRSADCVHGLGFRQDALSPNDRSRPMTFGRSLACAALKQTSSPVIYWSRYRHIAYPGGDVPWYLGTCADLVVRAYRAVGIDLQRLVYEELDGDPNVGHRQVRNLRRFFARRGASLPISSIAGDYLPGDLVTYALSPVDSRRDHIAIVSSYIGPNGRPLIIHNRGFGPTIDDRLFDEPITGHYRFGPIQIELAGAPARDG